MGIIIPYMHCYDYYIMYEYNEHRYTLQWYDYTWYGYD